MLKSYHSIALPTVLAAITRPRFAIPAVAATLGALAATAIHLRVSYVL
jgi:hypothetical protein